MYCDHCQTTAADDAKLCGSCGGTLSPGAPAAADPASAPTVMLTVVPCESCGAPSLPGATLCLPCKRAFESILGATPVPDPVSQTSVETAPMPAFDEAATLLRPRASALPSAPGSVVPLDAAPTPVVPAAAAAQSADALEDDEEYEDEEDVADDLMAEEAATVLATAPAVPAPAAEAAPAQAPDWSTPSSDSSAHENIVAVAPWARKGPDADVAPPVEDPNAPEPVPWWERNGQQSPAASPAARYVPPPAAAPPPSSSIEATVARQSMRPKSAPLPMVPRRAAGNRRSLVIGAAIAGVAAIGTPVMWKLAFASRPTVVSAIPDDAPPSRLPERTPRPERTYGTAPAPAPAPSPRVYQDLLPPTPAPEPTPVRPAANAATHAAPRPAPSKKNPAAAAAALAPPTPAPVAAPEPEPLPVAPPPVAAAPVAAAPAPSPVAEAVPLGQIYEVSQVETRPAVTSRFDPVLPARMAGQPQVVLIVRVLVSPGGRAAEAKTVKNPTNDDGLSAAAAATVRQWAYLPATKKGQAVSCYFNVGVVFKPASGN